MKFEELRRYATRASLGVLLSFTLAACSGGGGGGSEGSGGTENNVGVDDTTISCDGSCANANSFLTVSDIQEVMSQAVHEAEALGAQATIAVTDRVGNVLAVYQMNGADNFLQISSTHDEGDPIDGGLDRVDLIPVVMGSIAKAVTASFLSSEGNAFTSRTASQIVQDHFNPAEDFQPSGPLFGVQFSQLPCSDLSERFTPGSLPGIGPRRSPLGLSADPGGLPLFKGGTPVGAVGVMADGIYGLDKNIAGDLDRNLDELIAVAASMGFQPPVDRRANQITVLGKILRFSDAGVNELTTNPADAAPFTDIDEGVSGRLVAVPGYFDGTQILSGTAFGQPASGIRAENGEVFGAGNDLDAFLLVDEANNNRFPPIAGTDGNDPRLAGSGVSPLQPNEVVEALRGAIATANRARAQIRRPLSSPIRVSVFVVDSNGVILGFARTRDAPIFGIDVSLQKARTAAFFSRPDAGTLLRPLPNAQYIVPETVALGATPVVNGALTLPGGLESAVLREETMGEYVDALQAFIGIPVALEADINPLTGQIEPQFDPVSGEVITRKIAFSDRGNGNLSRPFYPDGIDDGPNGPLSKNPVINEWSIFSTGLQLDLIYNAVINHVAFVAGLVPFDVPQNCGGAAGITELFTQDNSFMNVPNGIQIFPGSVPIYKQPEGSNDPFDAILVGGIGISGDGVDQDDLVGFFGLSQGSIASNGSFIQAPEEIRISAVEIPGQERTRFVNCPPKPFNDTDDDEVCDGL